MSDTDTNTDVKTSESEGKNTDVVTGESATDSNKSGDNKPKTFSQDEVNNIIKQRLAENTSKVKRDLEKQYEGKHVFTEDDLTKLRKDIETSVRTSMALENKRAEYKSKGLTDAQLEAVQVEKPEDFDKRVEELFGALLKKDAPNINPGNPKKDVSELEDTNNYLRQGLKRRRV